MQTYFHSYRNNITAILVVISLASCKKYVEVAPPTSEITGATVYSNGTSAAAVMTGLYYNMTLSPGLSVNTGYFMGLAADELDNYDPTNIARVQFYKNALNSSNQVGWGASSDYFWGDLYNDIYTPNAVLEALSKSGSVTDSVKQRIEGEAEFMRAFFHFYATNLFGDVPLVTSTNYLVNNSISRSPQVDVYKRIIADLRDAQSKLSNEFVDASGKSTAERTRPNRGAASALLARVYLYTAKWDSAETEATNVINNSSLYSLTSLNGVFLANSTEAIWQLQPVNPGYNTFDAMLYVLQGPPGPGSSTTVALRPGLVNAFETGDARFKNWVGADTTGANIYYYPFKYKVWQYGLPLTEYTMVLRLAEQYLIRAEARAEQNKISGAVADLDVIRNRAGLGNYSGVMDQPSVLAAIQHEREVELFTEWGHRWFDLKRTNNLNSVMGNPGNVCQAKGGNWNPDWALIPIVLQELQLDRNLTQNPGY